MMDNPDNYARESYPEVHVGFVTSQNGTSVGEILKILVSISMMPIFTSLLLPWVVYPTFTYYATMDSMFYNFVRSIIEYPVIVVFPLCFMTLTAGNDVIEEASWNDLFWIVILCACLGIMVVNYSITQPKWDGIQAFWKKIKDKSLTSHSYSVGKQDEKNDSIGKESVGDKIKYPFITNYRGIVIYVTVIAILAVDFPIFPRRFAKTKKYGYSLMDIGTGSFIFSNGIVAPEAKDRKSNLLKSWISSVPLFVLGFIRLISVKGIEYHEVIEEYGVHWNFFFTLACVKLLSALIFSFVEPANSMKLSCIVGVLYEIVLSRYDLLESYLLNSATPRDNIFDANREGLFSVLGYLCIYFGSVYVGQVVQCVKSQSIKDWTLYAGRTGIQILMLWIGLQISVSYGTPSCRRAANLSYCLWILATNYTILWVLVVASIIQAICQHVGLLHGPLISYELKNLMEREEGKIKSLNRQLKKKCYGKSIQEVEIEGAISLLEDKLREFEQSGKASIYSEVKDLIKHLEKELVEIGVQLEEEEKEEKSSRGIGSKSSEKNLITMPDLTKSPVTLEAICYNGLLVFLLGNVLTGLVNCLVYTIYVPFFLAFVYLMAYCSIVSSISLILYAWSIQLKFW